MEPASREELMNMHRNRRLMYSFLSRMYEREISADTLKELSDGQSQVLRVGPSSGADDKKLTEGFELFGKYLKSTAGRDPNQVKLELAVEYADLFLGVKGRPLHPSESVYLSREQSMYQESRDRVMSVYWKAGVDKTKEFTEPEDHIAVELQFMEYLCRRTVEALEKDEQEEAVKFLQIQRDFIGEHLSRWVPRLAKDILASAEADFYRGVAEITDAFIHLDAKAVSASLDEMK